MCASDCGTCEHCQQTDDYGQAWRNPAFRSPDDAPPSTDSARPATETRREPEPLHGPALTRDGFTEALLRRDGPDGGEHGARCTADVTHRDEEHRVSRCALPAGHAPLVHDDGEGCQWTDGQHWRDGGR